MAVAQGVRSAGFTAAMEVNSVVCVVVHICLY